MLKLQPALCGCVFICRGSDGTSIQTQFKHFNRRVAAQRCHINPMSTSADRGFLKTYTHTQTLLLSRALVFLFSLSVRPQARVQCMLGSPSLLAKTHDSVQASIWMRSAQRRPNQSHVSLLQTHGEMHSGRQWWTVLVRKIWKRLNRMLYKTLRREKNHCHVNEPASTRMHTTEMIIRHETEAWWDMRISWRRVPAPESFSSHWRPTVQCPPTAGRNWESEPERSRAETRHTDTHKHRRAG